MILELKNSLESRDLILNFLNTAGASLKSFRYFSTRPIDYINNHLITILLFDDGVPIGYGHLDRDGNDIWLGICVSDKYTGKSKGKLIMEYLLNYADNNCLVVILKVDFENIAAISLYGKYSFSIFFEKPFDYYLMRRECVKIPNLK